MRSASEVRGKIGRAHEACPRTGSAPMLIHPLRAAEKNLREIATALKITETAL
jgi:hypothetical protein